ncbi:MAG: glycerophosphodiester phosphodiesterase, partial [Parapedobacter sp.]
MPGLRNTYFLIGILLFLVVGTQCQAQERTLHRLEFKSPKQLHRFFKYKRGKTIISGHRGTVEQGLTENSIAGMEAVLRHTPAFFEIDPRLTKDGVVVLMHDATLDRTTTGTGKLADHTWEEVKQLRLKDRYGKETE